ncbi:hypothetical protein KS4_06720 [Poriferisphaera corsica]|uniref:Choice-of-anchor A domain-containing protein n=1 Tax=Poriferisphaera corsica TaxID=2528020 RepID=A0A517YQX5_9BACT|nr:choice-of-anchor A family protein [Poriferisphaera corsica]QDU32638.1 hypothetical protein KS4_06720 [Poriferisphaera corsica]
MIRPTTFVKCALAASITLIATSLTQAAPLPIAGDYNTFVFGNANLTSDTQGRLAVGGDLVISNYSVGDQLTPTDIAHNSDVLVVGGSLNFNSGHIYHGNAIISAPPSQNNIPQSASIDGQYFQGAPSPIDFNAAKTALSNYATQLTHLASNGSVIQQWGGITLSGDNTSPLQIFDLNATDLLNSHTLNLNNVAQDATVLINVTGDTAGMTNMGLFGFESIRQNVLFNFADATSLTLQGIGVQGSVLAPNASLTNGQGVIWGQIILDSMQGNLQQNLASFDGDLPPIPEPTTTALLATSSLILLTRRNRKTS